MIVADRLFSLSPLIFLLNSFDLTWNKGLGDLAGVSGWGRVDGCRVHLLLCHILSWTTLLAYWHLCSPYWSSECIVYNQSLLHAERRDIKAKGGSHRETIIFSHNKSDNLCSSDNMSLLFFKTIRSCDFDLEAYFILNNWSKILYQHSAQWLPQIDTMQLKKGDVCLVWGCLRWAHPAPTVEEEVTEPSWTEEARLLRCYKYQEASSQLLVQGLPNLIKRLSSPLLGPVLKGHRWRARVNRKGPLSHHRPHVWRLVCLECIKPGLSGFPVKTGCLPLLCLITKCSLQGNRAQYTRLLQWRVCGSRNPCKQRESQRAVVLFSEIIVWNSLSWVVLFRFCTQECKGTHIKSHLVRESSIWGIWSMQKHSAGEKAGPCFSFTPQFGFDD